MRCSRYRAGSIQGARLEVIIADRLGMDVVSAQDLVSTESVR